MDTISSVTIGSLSGIIFVMFLKSFLNQKVKFSIRARVGNQSSDGSIDSPQLRPSRVHIEPNQNNA